MSLKNYKTEKTQGYLILGVYFAYNFIFWILPLIWLLVLTFSSWKFINLPKFTGFQNIIKVLKDQQFWLTIYNTFRFILYFIPVVFVFSTLFALLLKRVKHLKSLVVLCFLAAYVSSGVAYSIMFQNLFSNTGPLNIFLKKTLGFSIPWFTSRNFAMMGIALMVTWKFVGYYGLILYSGMISIPVSLYEAAELETSSNLIKFFKITLPLLNNQIIIMLVLSLTLTFRIFTEPYIITGGGPMESTLTPMMLMYTKAFKSLSPSYAATMSMFVALLNFGLIFIVRKIFDKDVEVV